MLAGVFHFAKGASAEAIVFENPRVNLGKVRAIGNIDHRFKFHVDPAGGAGPHTFYDLRPSCGCMQPTLAKKTVMPGETGEIVLAIHATSQKLGPKQFQLAVDVRDPEPRTIRLAVDIDFASDVTVQPASLLVYVNGSSNIKQTVLVTDSRAKAVKIAQVSASSAKIAPVVQADGNAARIELDIAGDVPAGRFDERLHVRLDDPDYPEFEVPVTIIRNGRVRVLPENLRLNLADTTNKPINRRLIIRDRDGKPVRITDVSCPVPGVQSRWPMKPTPRADVDVIIDPNHRPGESTEITIHVAEPVPAQLVVPLIIEGSTSPVAK